MRTKARITVTVPKELLDVVEAEVAAGRVASVSAWVSEAMQAKAEPRTVAQIIDDLADSWGDGPLTEEERAWARQRLAP
ncbi:hypothetical protein [Aquihabitans sp. McL0605]|uniref:hypothetical protein n=1 Tax=Aquihabitans sp. McL0605 TaxID=3415671 RepID=UPI003CF33657